MGFCPSVSNLSGWGVGREHLFRPEREHTPQSSPCHHLLQSQKLRDVFNMDFPDNHFLLKTLTVVSGPDMVDLTFHNFVSYKENVGKVHREHLTWVLIPRIVWTF